jgi:hypothetical protein
MQPFGLFNLLKSTLFSELFNPPPSTANSEEQPPIQTNQEEVSPTENDKSVALSSQEQPVDKPNACLDFLNRHEIRAGRQRK